MAQPYRGRTEIVFTHPVQDISWRTLDNVGEVAAKLGSALNAAVSGFAPATTSVYVAQGGVQASGTVTLTDVGGTAATGSFTYSGASGTTTATIRGVAFAQTTGTDGERGDELEAQVSASMDPLINGVITASSNGAGEVTLTAVANGTAANAYTTTATGTGLTAGGATFTGGEDNTVTITPLGTVVATDCTDLTDSAAATACAEAINASGALEDYVTAGSSGAVVTVTAIAYGLPGNQYTLTSSSSTTGTAVASGAKLAGGTAATGQVLVRP